MSHGVPITFGAARASKAMLKAANFRRFGSEMAWDSTCQEGWGKYFGYNTAQHQSAPLSPTEAIIAYQPPQRTWGYNGNARRYWYGDFGL